LNIRNNFELSIITKWIINIWIIFLSKTNRTLYAILITAQLLRGTNNFCGQAYLTRSM